MADGNEIPIAVPWTADEWASSDEWISHESMLSFVDQWRIYDLLNGHAASSVARLEAETTGALVDAFSLELLTAISETADRILTAAGGPAEAPIFFFRLSWAVHYMAINIRDAVPDEHRNAAQSAMDNFMGSAQAAAILAVDRHLGCKAGSAMTVECIEPELQSD